EKLRGREEWLIHPEPEALPEPSVFARPIAYNVVPLCENPDPDGSGFSTEELKMGQEARKILGIPDLQVAATSVRVPTVAGHGISIYARFDSTLTPGEARETLSAAPGLRVLDDLAGRVVPTPLDAAGI